MSELETGLESSKININRKLEGYRASIDKLHSVAKCNTSQLDKLGSQHRSLGNTVTGVTSRIDSLSQDQKHASDLLVNLQKIGRAH
eukprot:3932_1